MRYCPDYCRAPLPETAPAAYTVFFAAAWMVVVAVGCCGWGRGGGE
jgi:hypothetical protein